MIHLLCFVVSDHSVTYVKCSCEGKMKAYNCYIQLSMSGNLIELVKVNTLIIHKTVHTFLFNRMRSYGNECNI